MMQNRKGFDLYGKGRKQGRPEAEAPKAPPSNFALQDPINPLVSTYLVKGKTLCIYHPKGVTMAVRLDKKVVAITGTLPGNCADITQALLWLGDLTIWDSYPPVG